jgi:hypothetical protein
MRRTVVKPAGSDIGAIEETVAFLDYFKERAHAKSPTRSSGARDSFHPIPLV